VHSRRFGKAERAAHKPLDPRPQIDMFAFNGLRVLLANGMLRIPVIPGSWPLCVMSWK
jgi:hypothetical protein